MTEQTLDQAATTEEHTSTTPDEAVVVVADEAKATPDEVAAALPAPSAGVPAVTGPPSPGEWNAILAQAQVIARSGLVPEALQGNPDAVAVIALKGRELAVPPMQALSHIHVIDGKPTMSAELMVALVQRAGHEFWMEHTDEKHAVAAGQRRGSQRVEKIDYTIEDAKKAKIFHKQNWDRHPKAMLRARATSALCRITFADVLMGVSYTPEEMGAEVDYDGQVIDLDTAGVAGPVEAWEALVEEVREISAERAEKLLDYVYGQTKRAFTDLPADAQRQWVAWLQGHMRTIRAAEAGGETATDKSGRPHLAGAPHRVATITGQEARIVEEQMRARTDYEDATLLSDTAGYDEHERVLTDLVSVLGSVIPDEDKRAKTMTALYGVPSPASLTVAEGEALLAALADEGEDGEQATDALLDAADQAVA